MPLLHTKEPGLYPIKSVGEGFYTKVIHGWFYVFDGQFRCHCGEKQRGKQALMSPYSHSGMECENLVSASRDNWV